MDYSFEGYKRSDGSVGIRNHIGVICTVVCSSVVAREISEKVPGAIPFVHGNGCAQLGDDFKLTKNMLMGISANPNLYSALLVGLGCETNQVSGLLKSIPKTKPVKGIGIQQLAGGENTIKAGIEIAEQWSREIVDQKRKRFPISSLTVGILPVDLDEAPLNQLAPVIGGVVDKLVEKNAKVLFGFSKTLEPAGEPLSERAGNENVRNRLQTIGEGLQRKRWKEVTNGSMAYAEFTEQEKALSLLEARMTGTHSIRSVLGYSETPEEAGLHLITVPNNIVEALSNMASSGCSLVIIVSSRGVLTGSIALPCMTIAPKNPNEAFDELIDYTVTTEEVSTQVEAIIAELLEICSGKQTSLEKLELGEFSIPHVGTTF
ncbi:altronate hydrolase [Bacillus timonensis]|uniref:Altronate hydrolase n=1 Tax=Bacillus timonensis TaxID=1033734 RepID=A0A4S3PQU9_9BACI|nr:UxaA family hydrolase [Bacillus timonensis]THE11606.1 altronate hydrolase [Bacillus timonensis]